MSQPTVRHALERFVAERDWAQFHSRPISPRASSSRPAELLECFQWSDDAPTAIGSRDELADVLTYCHLLAARLGVDPDQIVLDKLEETKAKYPVDRSRGRSAKYDQL